MLGIKKNCIFAYIKGYSFIIICNVVWWEIPFFVDC